MDSQNISVILLRDLLEKCRQNRNRTGMEGVTSRLTSLRLTSLAAQNVNNNNKNVIESNYIIKDKTDTNKRLKRTLFIRTKRNMRILGVIPFIKLQNDT